MNQNNASTEVPIVVAMTGASGAIYAGRLLESLICSGRRVHFTMSDSAASVVRQELGCTLRLDGSNMLEMLRACDEFLQLDPAKNAIHAEAAAQNLEACFVPHHYKDYFTPIASGSFLTSAMVICPCSGSTLSGIAHASSNNLIQRAADVHLKERRKLIVVPRETPVNTFQLENMHRLSRDGVVVLPASPGWYHGVNGMLDLVDFVVARILDQLNVDNQQMSRWGE